MVGARSLRRRAASVAVVLSLAVVAAACGVEPSSSAGPFAGRDAEGPVGTDGDVVGSDIEPTTSSAPPTTSPPPDDVDITGDDGSDLNRVAANAIADLQTFWAEQYPVVYGDEYEPVAGGYFAIDGGSDPATLPCQPPELEIVLYNAYYCPADDAVAWDQEGLFPDLAEEYGPFVVAVVLAHEWGHAIQERADVDEPTVVTELQADCFAGAWARHVRDDGDARFDVSIEDLDRALAGVLSLRDAPGSLADDPNAHGSGFDRVGAFQDGYEDTAARCAEYTVGDPANYQFEFSDQDLLTGGDLPFEDGVDPDGQPVEGITTSAFVSLEDYWADVFPDLSDGEAWEPLEAAEPFDPDDPPTCNDRVVRGFKLFYCVPDRYVGFDADETMPEVYEFGDFAVGVLFGSQYGLAVQDQLEAEAPDEVTATLRGDCYAGAWAGALLPDRIEQDELPYYLALSPGDLDEAVTVLLSFRSDAERERQGPGFERVKAFRSGVVRGPEACLDLESDGS